MAATQAIVVQQPKRVSRRAPRIKRRRHGRTFELPLAIVGGFIPFIGHTYRNFKNNGAEHALTYFAKPFIPYDPMTGKFAADKLSFGLYPVIAGLLIHWLVGGKLGVNRALGRARIPIIRI